MSFEGLLGQEGPRDFFARLLAEKRLAHAYLFTGPEGVGKRAFARLLAAALFCRERPPGCGRCGACRRAAAGQHPDFHLVEPALDEKTGKLHREIRIEEVRRLLETLHRAGLEGGWRVAVFDPAEAITEEAANALLKTLEEPPAEVLLLLLSSQPRRLPDTVLSRCQRVRFAPLPEAAVAEGLRRAGVPAAEAGRLAARGAGSVGEALRAWTQREEGQRREDWLRRLFAGEPPLPLAEEIHQALRQDAGSLEESRQRFLEFARLYGLAARDLAVGQAADGPAPLLHPELHAELAGRAAGLDQAALEELFALGRRARGQVLANANLQLVIECFLLDAQRELGCGQR